MADCTDNARLVVGLMGGSGSGKTHLALRIVDVLSPESTYISTDYYFRHDPRLKTLEERRHSNWDEPAAFDFDRLHRDLLTLLNGHEITVTLWDFERSCPSAERTIITPAPFLILEGTNLFCHAPIRALIDMKVFLDVPADLRLLRKIRRDLAERARAIDYICAQYERSVRPMHRLHVEPCRMYADLVLDGEQEVEVLATEIASVCRAWYRQQGGRA